MTAWNFGPPTIFVSTVPQWLAQLIGDWQRVRAMQWSNESALSGSLKGGSISEQKECFSCLEESVVVLQCDYRTHPELTKHQDGICPT